MGISERYLICKSPLFQRDHRVKGGLYGNPSCSYFTLKLQNLQCALNATTVWQQFVTGGICLVSTKCLRWGVVAHTSLLQSKVRIDTNEQALPLTHFHFISYMNIHNGSSVVCQINDSNAICRLPKHSRLRQEVHHNYFDCKVSCDSVSTCIPKIMVSQFMCG